MPIKERKKNETKGQIDEYTLDRIMEEYGLKDFLVLPIVQLNGNIVVLNNHSETTFKAIIKAGEEKYMLKQVPWYCSSKKFTEFMVYFQENLLKEGFSVPELISSKKKKYVEINDDFFYLQKFIPAKTYDGSIIQTFNAGMSLGELHLASQKIKLNKTQKTIKENVFDIAKDMIYVLNSLLENNLDYFNTETVSEVKSLGSSLINQLDNSKIKSIYIYEKQQIIVQGDYNPLNVLFAEDGKIKVTFDLDNCTIDNPVHDLAEGLIDFSFNIYKPHSTRFLKPPKELMFAKAKAFLEGYKSANENLYLKINSLLPSATKAVCTELLLLGIVRGDYDINAMYEVPQILNNLELETNKILKEIK